MWVRVRAAGRSCINYYVLGTRAVSHHPPWAAPLWEVSTLAPLLLHRELELFRSFATVKQKQTSRREEQPLDPEHPVLLQPDRLSSTQKHTALCATASHSFLFLSTALFHYWKLLWFKQKSCRTGHKGNSTALSVILLSYISSSWQR